MHFLAVKKKCDISGRFGLVAIKIGSKKRDAISLAVFHPSLTRGFVFAFLREFDKILTTLLVTGFIINLNIIRKSSSWKYLYID